MALHPAAGVRPAFLAGPGPQVHHIERSTLEIESHFPVAFWVVEPVLAHLDEQEQVDPLPQDSLELVPRRLAQCLELLTLLADQDGLLAIAQDVDGLVDPHLAAVRRLGPALSLDRDAVGQLLVQSVEDLLSGDLGGEGPIGEIRELVFGEQPGSPRSRRR